MGKTCVHLLLTRRIPLLLLNSISEMKRLSWRPHHAMYLEAVLSSWGERMWAFGVGLFLMYSSPESLWLTALYGLVTSGSVIVMGASIGRWVDNTPRLRAAQTSLVVQNLSIAACAATLVASIVYQQQAARTNGQWLKIALQALVILLADVAALANLANKITIEKDWIVVVSDGDMDKLAWMNSTLRSIDLVTMILAPVLVGQLMTFLSPEVAAVFMAVWNLVSMVAEFLLLRAVYKQVPQLARRPKQPQQDFTPSSCCNPIRLAYCGLVDIAVSWRIYFKSSFRDPGLALASLYMTVLGFDNITTGYGYSQHLSESTLSMLMAAGAVIGILGSVSYTGIRGRWGLTWAGGIGFTLAVASQLVSVAAMFLPGTAFWPFSAAGDGSKISVITLFTGIILARFGLWIGDLSVTQLLQERVCETQRGTVSGVQGSLNMCMDTLKYLLVMMLPRPADFAFLAFVSFVFWMLGWLLYMQYACRSSGRLDDDIIGDDKLVLMTSEMSDETTGMLRPAAAHRRSYSTV